MVVLKLPFCLRSRIFPKVPLSRGLLQFHRHCLSSSFWCADVRTPCGLCMCVYCCTRVFVESNICEKGEGRWAKQRMKRRQRSAETFTRLPFSAGSFFVFFPPKRHHVVVCVFRSGFFIRFRRHYFFAFFRISMLSLSSIFGRSALLAF